MMDKIIFLLMLIVFLGALLYIVLDFAHGIGWSFS